MAEILLHAEPGVVLSWEEFQAVKPPFSMALDGYVYGQTKYSPEGPYANFNHHEAVDRLATRSTCMQTYFSIKLGLFDAFRRKGAPFAHVYVNDADQDVCLSYWLLKHPEAAAAIRWDDPMAQFVVFEDFIDASAGSFPFSDSSEMNLLFQKQAWVFEPYTTARGERTLHAMSGAELSELIENVCDRITLFSQSKGGTVELVTQLEVIGGGVGWRMIRERSAYDRTAIYSSGVHAFVGMRKRNDGNFTYVIGKMSPYVQFPLLKLYEALNEEEKRDAADNSWGGSDIIGGSPRKSGSSLSPGEVEAVINTILESER